jgi:drug/metabolite transporter (DMT)-like permease
MAPAQSPPAVSERRQRAKGMICIALSAVCFSVMSVFVKECGVDSFKAAMVRFSVGMAVLGTAAFMGKIELKFVENRALFMRGLFGAAGVVLFFLSLTRIGVAKGTIFSYSYPLFATVGAMIILREPVRRAQMAAVMMGFVGIVQMVAGKGSLNLSLGQYEGLAILGAGCSGLAVVFVKKLRATDSAYAIFMSQCATGFWVAVVPAFLLPFDRTGTRTGVMLLLVGLAGAAAQLLMTYGIRFVPVVTSSLLALLTPALSLVIGVVFYREPVSGGEWVGVMMVMLSCATVAIPRRAPQPV